MKNVSKVWKSALVRGGPGLFPPDLVVQIKALACELPATCNLPLARWSVADLSRQVRQSGLIATISDIGGDGLPALLWVGEAGLNSPWWEAVERLLETNPNPVVHPDAELRPGVALDRHRRMALTDHLFFDEALPATLTFAGTVLIKGSLSSQKMEFLKASARLVDRLGGRKAVGTRAAARGDRPASAGRWDMTAKTLAVRITTLSPALLAAGPPAHNLIETQDFIPGNSLRCLLARRYLDRGGSAEDDTFKNLFLSGEARFGFAYLQSCRVIPVSARSCKYHKGFRKDGNHGVVDLLLEDPEKEITCQHKTQDNTCKRDVDYFAGYWDPRRVEKVEVARRLITRTAIAPDLDTAQKGQLYSQRLIAEG